MSLKRFFGCVLRAFFLSELATVSQRVVRGRALNQLRCIELLHSHVREAASLLHKKPRQKQKGRCTLCVLLSVGATLPKNLWVRHTC